MMHSYRISDKDFAGLVFLSTKGDARDVLWQVNPEEFESDDTCYSNMMSMPNKVYDRPE